MEDEDEIRSQMSPAGSDSLDSPPPIGQITVTVAATAQQSSPPPPEPNALTLALPDPPAAAVTAAGNCRGAGGGREDCWSEGATAVLIDAWGERYLELSRGNLKQQHWKEVAEIVSSREDYTKTPKTDIQCKNRIDTVKKKYKQEKARMAACGGPSRWVFYDKLDRLIGTTAKISSAASRVPMGIPMSTRSSTIYQNQNRKNQNQENQNQQVVVKRSNESKRWRFKKRNALSDSESESEPELSADSADSLPPPPLPKRAKTVAGRKDEGGGGRKWGELTRAILRFGEAYEQAENAKLQQVVEMEKERMRFVKELELQRMQFFLKTQIEILQLRHGKRSIGNTSNDHGGKNNNNNVVINNNGGNTNNSDVSS